MDGAVQNQVAIDAWKTKDVLARHYIFATMDDSMKEAMEACSTAKEMWDRVKLDQVYNSSLNKQHVKTQFLNYTFKQGAKKNQLFTINFFSE